jgi:hypothetical protein
MRDSRDGLSGCFGKWEGMEDVEEWMGGENNSGTVSGTNKQTRRKKSN